MVIGLYPLLIPPFPIHMDAGTAWQGQLEKVVRGVFQHQLPAIELLTLLNNCTSFAINNIKMDTDIELSGSEL